MNLHSSAITKLHEKVIWFYRHLCENDESPMIAKFINETIPAAFKTMKDRQGLPGMEMTLSKQGSSESLGSKCIAGLGLLKQTSG